MCITYDTNQRPLFKHLFGWPKTKFNPPYPPSLVRITDMKIISPPPNKNDIKFCAISYPPSIYSGGIIRTDKKDDSETLYQQDDKKTTCKDQGGLHNLITYSPDPSTGKNRPTVENVKFEVILQRLCKDFGVEYLWYDKMCIDSSTKNEEKKYELSNIHYRYRSAQFTIALIPEMELCPKEYDIGERLTVIDDEDNDIPTFFNNNLKHCLRLLQQSKWCKAVWTYVEAIHSSTILFIGKNVHFTSDQIRALNNNRRIDDMLSVQGTRRRSSLYQLVDTLEEMYSFPGSASNLLRHVHARNVTSEQDRVFALVNILNDHKYMFIGHQFDYECPMMDGMVNLYGLLASIDLSVMCFGKPRLGQHNTISQYEFLPSWAGAAGKHAYNILKPTAQDIIRSNNIKGGIMYINCDCVKVYPIKHTIEKRQTTHQDKHTMEKENKKDIVLNIENLFGLSITHYMKQRYLEYGDKVNREDEAVHIADADIIEDGNIKQCVAYMSLLPQDVSSEDECLILDIPFDTKRGFACPVVIDNKDGYYYSIGVVFFTLYDWNFNALTNDPLSCFGTKVKSSLKIR
ncbi:hypothetical protein BDA99DRAFT_532733 [Phascolomyces articulosus]|uniref:Heterokaryon incompatibility domain-containing protein n=1 Tax=Phascolomyces articulosus TaxID=60185 RepID=A0AAD5PJ66_9FUNG|nr:hypothetical protein BDA99DRAFT_532733 [Phascolomyces articulosus]